MAYEPLTNEQLAYISKDDVAATSTPYPRIQAVMRELLIARRQLQHIYAGEHLSAHDCAQELIAEGVLREL